MGPSRAISAENYGNMTARGSILEHFGALWALLGRSLTTLGSVLASTWGLRALFFTILLEKSDLCISTPLSNGIAIIAGPGTQVGAIWAGLQIVALRAMDYSRLRAGWGPP